MPPTRNLAILLFEDVEVLDYCGPFEVFTVANRFTDPPASSACQCHTGAAAGANGHPSGANDLEELVHLVTDQVMAALDGARR
jgi:hypothetical protein